MKLIDIINHKEIKILENNKEILESGYSKLIFGYAKFIVVSRDNEYCVTFLKSTATHSDIAMLLYENEFNFVGAGSIMIKKNYCSAFFSSESCEYEFGYDAPSDENIKNSLLDDLKNAFKNLIEIFS